MVNGEIKNWWQDETYPSQNTIENSSNAND
jgi:hypothetical protein